MKKVIFLLLTFAIIFSGCASLQHQPAKPASSIKAVPFTGVEVTDSFWLPFIERNRTVSIPKMLKDYGQGPNLKLLEGSSYVLAAHPDPSFAKYIRSSIGRAAVGMLSGDPAKKWQDLRDGELYGAGHFLEAAAAYYEATNDESILNIAKELADHIDSIFGPDKRRDVSGHEEVKIGLLKLYRATGDEKYLQLAKFFIDERGYAHDSRVLYGEYAQDHKPVIKQKKAVGHCVRATYLYTPLADLANLTDNKAYAKASRNIWQDVVSKRMYLIGNFGSHRDYEDFGDDYELPNLGGWNETCSAIGNVFWSQKLFILTGDAKYVDVLERCLYNGFLAGVSLDGTLYLYQHVLQTFGDFTRHPWFGPNCCPPNVVRLIASLPGYIYAHTDNELYVNLFMASNTKVILNNTLFGISQQTNYPWNGSIKITVTPEKPTKAGIYIRVPCWSQNKPVPSDLYKYTDKSPEKPQLKINGKPTAIALKNGFAHIKRTWQKGDLLELYLPMPVRRVLAHQNVIDDRGRVALERGPLVYCAESVDNNANVFNLLIGDNAQFTTEYRKDLLGGLTVITGDILALSRDSDDVTVAKKPQKLLAIPYYAWAHRGLGQMAVWLAREESKVFLPPVPSLESTSRITTSCGDGSVTDNYPGHDVPTVAKRFYPRAQSGSAGVEAICDQIEPTCSADGSCPFLRLRPQQGDQAWVQYNFKQKAKISSTEVYFKDDKEYCLLPKSWRILYWDVDAWKPVENQQPYAVKKDSYSKVRFTPVTTDRLRLEIQLGSKSFPKGELGPPDGNYLKDDVTWYDGGILEWRVK